MSTAILLQQLVQCSPQNGNIFFCQSLHYVLHWDSFSPGMNHSCPRLDAQATHDRALSKCGIDGVLYFDEHVARVCNVCINGGVAHARAPRRAACACDREYVYLRALSRVPSTRTRSRVFIMCAFRKLTRVSLALVCQVTCERYCTYISSEYIES